MIHIMREKNVYMCSIYFPNKRNPNIFLQDLLKYCHLISTSFKIHFIGWHEKRKFILIKYAIYIQNKLDYDKFNIWL